MRELIIVTHEIDISRLFRNWKSYLILDGHLYNPITVEELLNSSIQEGVVPSAILVIEAGGKKFLLVKGAGYRLEHRYTLDRIYNL
ncbi:MAG: hypothetical protein N3D82_00270 [Ignisphaera sp.]|nr:hypothetical protein [Ignisphaera sp.]MCX8167450.1 hypothetical protein [Ignisphaera sp.]MDW8084686.1 hypothetical protein [Ignisphaera sp.]